MPAIVSQAGGGARIAWEEFIHGHVANEHTRRSYGTAVRRFLDAGLPKNLSPHSFRATTATDLINNGVPLEDVQHLLGHADARTTKLYDRTTRKVTRNIVERISIRSNKPPAP